MMSPDIIQECNMLDSFENKEKQEKIMNNFKNMIENMEFKDNMTPRLSEDELKTRKMMKLNADGSVLKLNVDEKLRKQAEERTQKVSWKKGSNARFRYKSYTFVAEEDKKDKHHHHHHDHHCDHLHDSDKISSTTTVANKPSKKLIANSDDDQELFQIRLGMGFTVEFFELCLKTMDLGEQAKFLVMPSMLTSYTQMEKMLRKERLSKNSGSSSYSTHGCCGHSIVKDDQENPDLTFLEYSPLEIEIELIDIQEPGSFEKEVWEMTTHEKISEAKTLKEKAKLSYQEKQYALASKLYERAIMLIESVTLSSCMVEAERELQKQKVLAECDFSHCELAKKEGITNPMDLYQMLMTLRLNYAACQLKLEGFFSVITQCSEVLKKMPNNVKATFRRAQAYSRLGRDLELAQQDLNLLKAILPKDEQGDIIKEEKLLEMKWKKVLKKEKEMYSNLFK